MYSLSATQLSYSNNNVLVESYQARGKTKQKQNNKKKKQKKYPWVYFVVIVVGVCGGLFCF